MIEPGDLLKAARHARDVEKNLNRALLLAKRILSEHPDSVQAVLAKELIADIQSKVAQVESSRQTVPTQEQPRQEEAPMPTNKNPIKLGMVALVIAFIYPPVYLVYKEMHLPQGWRFIGGMGKHGIDVPVLLVEILLIILLTAGYYFLTKKD